MRKRIIIFCSGLRSYQVIFACLLRAAQIFLEYVLVFRQNKIPILMIDNYNLVEYCDGSDSGKCFEWEERGGNGFL